MVKCLPLERKTEKRVKVRVRRKSVWTPPPQKIGGQSTVHTPYSSPMGSAPLQKLILGLRWGSPTGLNQSLALLHNKTSSVLQWKSTQGNRMTVCDLQFDPLDLISRTTWTLFSSRTRTRSSLKGSAGLFKAVGETRCWTQSADACFHSNRLRLLRGHSQARVNASPLLLIITVLFITDDSAESRIDFYEDDCSQFIYKNWLL